MIWITSFLHIISNAQDSIWTFEECINYALRENIDVQKAKNITRQNEVNYNQSKSNRIPTLEASVSHNLGWASEYNQETNEYGSMNSSNSTNYGINSGVTLFNGFKLKARVKKSQLDLQSGNYYSEKIKESVELSILEAYLNILYAKEEVSNAQKQIESTQEQLVLAEERMKVGIISTSDYLQIKSELATEKLTLANARSSLTMAKVTLMQLMELPLTDDFAVVVPDVDQWLILYDELDAAVIYDEALQIKPEVKEAELNAESVKLDEQIARAGLFPSISMNAGVSTGWMDNITGYNYTSQLENRFNPYIGLSLSVPIFQKNQARTDIKTAQISYHDAILEETRVKNNLRKEIEQAVTDAITAKAQYEASIEQYEAIKESYLVALEKYELGIINSVDFMIIKNDFIVAQSNLIQTKYNLVFGIKVIDFYQGNPIRLTN